MSLTILNGDALQMLRTLPDNSVQCCVTSPPYWGLRDYGCEGQMRRIRDRRGKKGLCVYCGKAPATRGKRCAPCADANARRAAAARRKARQAKKYTKSSRLAGATSQRPRSLITD